MHSPLRCRIYLVRENTFGCFAGIFRPDVLFCSRVAAIGGSSMLHPTARWRSSITANPLSNYLHSSLRNLFHFVGETLTSPPVSRARPTRHSFWQWFVHAHSSTSGWESAWWRHNGPHTPSTIDSWSTWRTAFGAGRTLMRRGTVCAWARVRSLPRLPVCNFMDVVMRCTTWCIVSRDFTLTTFYAVFQMLGSFNL